ncbi:cytosolic carboxypeptidase 2 isoform X3 [Oreochromis aureus]|uniref:cytosolic carboxypeptidase 2 isoform X3 n=1 Tax=Oreochromis aureus TaxID=47969 RepID=UPI001954E809|nr:cytosolic carboxypeptidase 2 isoform X3 [Oreochromis aureus]
MLIFLRRHVVQSNMSEECQVKIPVRDSTLKPTQAEKTSTMVSSAVRNCRTAHQLDTADTSYSRTDEHDGELTKMKQLCRDLSQKLKTTQLLVTISGGRPVISLRPPPELVNFSCGIRWPIECEVIGDIIHHIEWDPPEPEPFYQCTGYERTPMPVGEERGKVVFCIDHAAKHPYFTYSRIGGSREPIKRATFYDVSQSELTLEFESRFESGNLQKAVQVGAYDYELTLCTDMYTTKHTQWFYFRVRNMKAGVTYRFTIINLMKRSSLYSQGMKPLLYSERDAEENGVGWQRAGSNIKYYRNCSQNTKDNNSDGITLYSLSWTLQFPYDSDTCYLAHCYPYTYSRLQRYLSRITSNPTVRSYCKVRVLCQSLAGNAVYVITITPQDSNRMDDKTKKAVVVTARVHPGESNASWIMEGFLNFLLGDSDDAQLLRDTFVFKAGTSTETTGHCSEIPFLLCGTPETWWKSDTTLKLHERVFPLMMSKNASNKFSFNSCKFRVQKSKEGTGRIVMWRLGIKNSYTMEATFGGSTLGDRRGTHFTIQDLKSLGFHLCDTLLDYCDPDPIKITYCLAELALLEKEFRERLGKDLGNSSDLETSTSGSDSSDSEGLPLNLLNQPETYTAQTPVTKKKKHFRSRKERNRRRPNRVKNKTQQKESDGAPDKTIKESVQKRPAERHRKKPHVNSLMRKGPTITHHGEVSQENSDLRHSPEPCPLHSKYTGASPHKGDPDMETGQPGHSSPPLNLRALIPPSSKIIKSSQHQHHCHRQSFTPYKFYKGLPPLLTPAHGSPKFTYVNMSPEIIPRRHLLTSFNTNKFSGQHIFRDRSSWLSHYVDAKGTSRTEMTKTKWYKREDNSSEVDSSLFRHGVQNLKAHTHDTSLKEPNSCRFFVPVLRDLTKIRKSNDKRHGGILPSSPMREQLPRPQSDTVSVLQAKDIRLYRFGEESHTTVTPQEVMVKRTSQSALHKPKPLI